MGRPVAQQRRSLRTEDKLLAAAARVLQRDGGLEGATVPRIAAEAKLSPASIYRRFADKDDLLRATFLRLLDTTIGNGADGQRTLTQDTLAETVEALTSTLLKGHRDRPQWLRSLNRMIEADPDSPFAAEARQRLPTTLVPAAQALLAHRDSIRHPDPERAARFAVLSAVSAIELAAGDGNSLWHVTLPLSEKAFSAELSRQMMAYLRRKP